MTSEPPSESSPVVPVEETKWWEIHAELQVNNKLCYFENDMKIWGIKVEQTKRKLMIINNSDYVQQEEDGSKFFILIGQVAQEKLWWISECEWKLKYEKLGEEIQKLNKQNAVSLVRSGH